MLDAFNALVPIFLVIACGILIRRIHYIPDNVWPAIDQLCWYVLFPILIVKTLALADLDSVPVRGLASALALSAIAIIALLFAIKPLLYRYLGISGPGFTSFFQGTSRWNGFAALAIIQALYGEDGRPKAHEASPPPAKERLRGTGRALRKFSEARAG